MLNEIKRLLKNELNEIKNDDQPNSLKDKYINEGIIEGIEIANKIINVVAKNHYNAIKNELSSTLECEKESYDNGNKLVRRQEYLITMLTDDQDEYLDMLEEFYDISLQLNNLKQ